MFRKIYFLLIAAALSAMLWLNACEWMKFPPAPVCQKQENEPVKQRMFTTDEGDADCVLTDNGTVEYRGRFRHRWWNYYNRAMCFAEKGCWEQAIEDFEKAIEQRGKDEKDQWDARTYGMRFMDYFPRREMGIAYYYLAKEKQETEEGYKTAVEKLEDSLSHTPTAKAIYYLEKVYKDWVALGGEQKPLVPEINVQPFWTKDEPVVLSGTVEDKKYIRKIGVNVTNKKNFRSYEKLKDESFEPVFILNGLEDFKRNLNENQLKLLEEQKTLTDLTTNVSFKKQFLFLPQGEYAVTIRAENIMGGVNDHKVDIRVDRLGPMITIADKKYSDLDKTVTISGFLGDESGISSLFMNNQQVVVKADNSFEAEAKADEKEVELAAVDQLGNRTVIMLDISYSAIKSDSALYANVGMAEGEVLLSEHRNIEIKNLKDKQIVYGNRVYVEIEITNLKKNKIKKLIINSSEIELSEKQQQSETITSVYDVELNNNKIIIKAIDEKGNDKFYKEIDFIKESYEAYKEQNRFKILIFPFEDRSKITDIRITDIQCFLVNEIKSIAFDSYKNHQRFRAPKEVDIKEGNELLNRSVSPNDKEKIKVAKGDARTEGYRCIIVGYIEQGIISEVNSEYKDNEGTEIVADLYDTEKDNYMNLPKINIYRPPRLQNETPANYYKSMVKELAKKLYIEIPFVSVRIAATEDNEKSIRTELDTYPKIKENIKLLLHSEAEGIVKGKARVLEQKFRAEVEEKKQDQTIREQEDRATTE